jgi:hypothetical protein
MKRPAKFTTLAKYSKMKGVSKLAGANKVPRRDTDTEVAEVLEQALDGIFCLDAPGSAKKSAMSTSKTTELSDQSEQEDIEEQPQAAKRCKEIATREAPVRKAEVTLVAARRKELALMSKNTLQELVESKELEKGKKDDMIEALLAYEAKVRDDQRCRDGQAKQVVVKKREELGGRNNGELKALCGKLGLKFSGSKKDRVTRILTKWKDDGGVEEALTILSRKARRNQLAAMDKKSLFQLCDKRRIDALVKEVMVERILSWEIIKTI